jgi:transcriptional regulator with XRE-family HTH domain
MRSTQELLQLKAQAISLRRAGKPRRQIKEALGIVSNATLDRALRGEPPPEWTRRPNAKDAVRGQARELREKGLDYEEIAAKPGVSASSVSLWVRDMPTPPHLTYEESRKRSAEGARRYWAAERPVREAAREVVIAEAAAEIGDLSDRELLIAGAIAYWCEGAKSKPGRRDDRVVFINSDPCLIRFFLCFLHAAGVERDRLTYRVHIHETADVAIAEQFWAEIAEVEVSQFKKPTLKRHNPKTLRKNIGDDYHGCLVIGVLRSAELYQQIAGWARGAMRVPAASGQAQ